MTTLGLTERGGQPAWIVTGAPSPAAAPDHGFAQGLTELAAAARAGRGGGVAEVSGGGTWLAPFGGTKIMCVGRNYRPHAEELGNPVPQQPLWFTKPPSSLVGHGGTVRLPAGFGRIDYEGEVAVLLGQRCRQASRAEAAAAVVGITAALDITARELQKADGQWTRAKGFDTFCPLGPVWQAAPDPGQWGEITVRTVVNDKVVQHDRLASLIFSIPELIEHLSACMTLEPGDVILTGTPAGVGPLAAGDRVRVELGGPVTMTLAVAVSAARTD